MEGGKVQAVNLLGAEDYLLSVVSLFPASEQRAQAIRIRRWLYSQLERRKVARRLVLGPELCCTPQVVTFAEHRPSRDAGPDELPVHAHFDVCAQEHCCRYIGLTPQADAAARAVIDETWGKLE